MGTDILSGGVIGIATIVLAVLVIRFLLKPIKWFVKLGWHVVCGLVLLFVVNYFGAGVGIALPVTALNVGVAGIFGIPGVIALVLAPYFL